ncbi:uncharacterized protein GGS22DRAFT_191038 [Annulohypoxylon maeteangense]|uniref:uncharacterized protein n=1 Tax=Annulohypoxylon maeteangense TaxID=1927788 RepID=UPI002008CEBE|nr:uncharacterized protein GGS22DRAFT_191038 [Annulohypoxylon maeteangense]KAI0882451.1 hypothetical protein GGS22DRAFT_191038 [Annulohypoxylon maeteangense]
MDYSKGPPPPYSFAGSTVQFQQQPQFQPQLQPQFQQPQYQQPQFQQQQQQQYLPPPQPLPQIPRQFPPAFNMYRASGLGNRHYTLGEHQKTPVYAISLHSGLSGQPDVVLHNGPQSSLPPLAAAEKSAWSSRGTVYLPPLPGAAVGKKGAAEERFENGGGLGHRTFSFAVEVGGGGGVGQREMFEWRHSKGGAVKGLDGRSGGWKLVRLAMGPPVGVDGAGFVQGVERGSDGREVVAVWAGASGSLSKILKFQFLGSGASGLLGERWAIMAVMTGLKIWDIERRARQAASASSGGGGA